MFKLFMLEVSISSLSSVGLVGDGIILVDTDM